MSNFIKDVVHQMLLKSLHFPSSYTKKAKTGKQVE